jgi:tryptophan halogenase
MIKKREIKDIAIVGGGTAGWLAALYAKKTFPNFNIFLIESDSIGILGAGEGSTPHLVSLLNELSIPLKSMINDAGATIKNGIKFTNWNNEGEQDFYYHPFSSLGILDIDKFFINADENSVPPLYVSAAHLENSLKNVSAIQEISEKNKVPLIEIKNSIAHKEKNEDNYEKIAEFSIHFDAAKLAETLKNIAIERGILRIEGVVKDTTQNNYGDVKKIILESGKSVDCDFIFDCSGFSRFFPKMFNSEWIDYSKHLPVNRALPFFLEIDKTRIPPYTESIAMNFGWMWKIPLQHRYGCGYVFDSSLISEEAALKEVEEYLGHKIKSPRTISFSAGYYKTSWVNNVVSIGLSSGFVEPLEATSIFTAILYMKKIFSNPESIFEIDSKHQQNFNNYTKNINEEVLSFIYFHYMSSRKNNDFWKKFTKEKSPNLLKKYLNMMEEGTFNKEESGNIWDLYSWLIVGEGIRYPNVLKNTKEHGPITEEHEQIYAMYSILKNDLVDNHCKDHYAFLKSLDK